MRPPQAHPTLFFLFDFVRNSRTQLQAIDANKLDRAAHEQVQEVLSRNNLASMLIGDTTGKLVLITGGDPSRPVDFGDEIREKARALTEG